MSLKPKQVNFNEVWQDLKETAKEVITLGRVQRGVWNDRFSDVYSLCVAYPEPLADKLYYETKQFLENHVQNMLATQVAPPAGNSGDKDKCDLLQRYYKGWAEYSQGIEYLNSLYLYLNHQHIRKQKISEAEIVYGNVSPDTQELMEIGELGTTPSCNKSLRPERMTVSGVCCSGQTLNVKFTLCGRQTSKCTYNSFRGRCGAEELEVEIKTCDFGPQ